MMDMTRIKVICTKWTMCVCQCLQAGVSMQVSTPEVRSLEPQSPAPSRCARRQALVFGWGPVPAGIAANLGVELLSSAYPVYVYIGH